MINFYRTLLRNKCGMTMQQVRAMEQSAGGNPPVKKIIKNGKI
jgi:hypothetical protein